MSASASPEIHARILAEAARAELGWTDPEGRAVYPALAALLARAPAGWSGLRLLHWLTRPLADLDATPIEALASRSDEVLAAFEHTIEPPLHG